MKLLEPLDLGRRRSPNRVLFGPHETNLGQGRAISERHAAYYRARAMGGSGIVVVEEASVHPSDWPYERCPLASEAGAGWAMTARACAESDTLVLAALGHSGGQGSSAYSQRELWAPSDEPEVNSREVPKVMEPLDIDAVVGGFRLAAATATEAGLDGVEINVGQHSLARQFLSGLTNRRDDAYGEDRVRFAREVLTATRAGLGSDSVLGLRLSCDELAPWAGLTPELAAPVAVELASLVDYLVVVRGSIFTVAETRPTGHHGTGFNLDLVAGIHEAIDGLVPVFAQGSIVDPGQAEWAIEDGRCDGVEMTRAQIADPHLVTRSRADEPVRPCVLCNQRCRVRDNRNPIVGCVVEPDAGHETARSTRTTGGLRNVLVVGAGPAGLEAASVAADSGASVTMVEAGDRSGGLLHSIARAPGHDRFALLADHLTERASGAGVSLQLGFKADEAFIRRWDGRVVLATGGRPASTDAAVAGDATLVSPLAVLDASPEELDELVPADVAVWDPIGNNIGVAVAELLAASGRAVTFITPDANAGTLLSLTGDLPGANVRLQQAGVRLERRQRLITVDAASATVAHAYTAAVTTIDAPVLVDCSPRLPADELWSRLQDEDDPGRMIRVGDAVATRTVAEAIREGRAAGLAIGGAPDHSKTPAPVVSA